MYQFCYSLAPVLCNKKWGRNVHLKSFLKRLNVGVGQCFRALHTSMHPAESHCRTFFRPWRRMCSMFKIEVKLIELTLLCFYKHWCIKPKCTRGKRSWSSHPQIQDEDCKVNCGHSGNQHRRIFAAFFCLFWDISATCDTRKETSDLTKSSSDWEFPPGPRSVCLLPVKAVWCQQSRDFLGTRFDATLV